MKRDGDARNRLAARHNTTRTLPRGLRAALAGVLVCAAATLGPGPRAGDSAPAPEQPAAVPKADQEITPDQVKGVPLEGLTEAQKGLVFSILSDNRCDCGCGMTLARCRAKDTTCGRSLALASQVLDLVKQGKGRDEIVKTALTPPSKFVQFDLPEGESPSVGPKGAKVTILYYLDHQ